MTNPAQIRYKLVSSVAIVLAVVALGLFSTFFGNTWLLLTGNGYEIPAESSIFTFDATVMNSGSGDWWLYGEDGKNYYQYTGQGSVRYIAYPKVRAINCRGFDPHNSATWCPLDTSDRRN